MPAVPHAQQFHTQDEFGNLAFGYSSPNSARYVCNLVVVSLTVMVAGNQTVQIAPLKDPLMLVFWSKLAPKFLIFLAFWLVQVRGGQLCEWSEAWRLQLGWCQRFRPEDRVRRRPNSGIPGMLMLLTKPRIFLEFSKALTNYQITDTTFLIDFGQKNAHARSTTFHFNKWVLPCTSSKHVLKEAKVSGSSKVEPFAIFIFWIFSIFSRNFCFDVFISGEALQT